MKPSSGNTAAIRSFIALELPGETREAVVRYCQSHELGKLAGLRPVRTDNLHLTLHFLGDQPAQTLHLLSSSLQEVLSGLSSFPLVIRGLGAFPRVEKPRVVWLGFEPSSSLLNLHGVIAEQLRRRGLPVEDRPFQAHLTLARVPVPLNVSDGQRLMTLLRGEKNKSVAQFQASTVILFQSELKPGGSVYKAISVHPLTDRTASGMV